MRNFSAYKNKLKLFVLLGTLVVGLLFWGSKFEAATNDDGEAIGETPIITEHLDQGAINDGRIRFQQLFEAGEQLFTARFNVLDGQGHPASTGSGMPTPREPRPREFIQSSGPTANSCAGCHYQPVIGGSGDFAVDVHVVANDLDPPTDSFSPVFGNERNSLGMQGAGAIELLAREMTADLHAIRDAAAQQARQTGLTVTLALITKGVEFGRITALPPDGKLITDAVEGVDPDLVIKPFHQKGVVNSIRVFTNNAMNHHHGIQSIERFGRAQTGTDDFDRDGVPDELTVGDITAATVWQASLGIPGRVVPSDERRRRAMERGEQVFNSIGCAECHRPFLVLNDPVFTEPNPFNPPGNLRPADVPRPFAFDLTREGLRPRLRREADGRVLVRAFTDLKRHVIGDQDFPHFLNERVIQAGVPLDQFITRKLWDAGNTAGYGHRGDLTTLTEAILNHGGEGRRARDAFAALPREEQSSVIEFLKSLQILPEGASSLDITEKEAKSLMKRK